MMMEKKKVGIITFHASHNYGSMLQAYALQQTVLGMGCECEIINFRTERQREFYRPIFSRGSFVDRLKRSLFYAPYLLAWKKKQQLFERFLKEKYRLSSKEYSTLEELEAATLDYDVYISGSDQIWNISALDFDWAYFLPFAGSSRRVAYAPSMGPLPHQLTFNREKADKTAELLKSYNHISVREQQTMEIVTQLTDADYTVTLDPTLLVESQKWSIMAGEAPLIKGNYIFLYTPWYNADVYEEANRMSKTLKIPIVVSLFHDGALANLKIMRRHYHCLLASGPLEFLNLCKFATYTIGKSFHLVAFSILFRKPFFAVNGMEDSRVIDLLKLTGLEHRSVSPIKGFSTIPTQIDFDEVHHRLADAKKQSLNWLRESLC